MTVSRMDNHNETTAVRVVPSSEREAVASVPVDVRFLRRLGNGRAAEANLVEARFANGRRMTCVEKVFRPGLLTRVLYRLAFQAPFPYSQNRHAIEACFYRRRVAGGIVRACEPKAHVAAPLYVRFDESVGVWVLASEWIRGRGPVPAPLDSRRVRRWLTRPSTRELESPAEMDELVALMRRLEDLFCESGLVGAGWQVCPRALVSTANLLKSEAGWTAIDLESGIPAVLVPRYIVAGIQLRSFPLFDDLAPQQLRTWIGERKPQLTAALGEAAYLELQSDVDCLIDRTARWKESEPALLRSRGRHASQPFSAAYRDATIDRWQQRDQIDEPTATALRTGGNGFRRLWLAGVIPVFGRFVQRLCGNDSFRARAKQFFVDSRFRRIVLHDGARRNVARWQASGRISPESASQLPKSRLRYGIHFLLSKCVPGRIHRWLTDHAHRRELAIRGFLLMTSARYQSAYGRHLIERSIRRWEEHDRIKSEEAENLRAQSTSPEIEDYLRGFSVHVALKCLAPVLLPFKIGGLYLWLRTGDPRFLLAWLALPILRTLTTVWSMFASRRRGTEYGEALSLGMLPTLGSLAYPAQMYSVHPQLSNFLLRDAASKAGQWLPIYGGRDSRTEFWFLRGADFLVEALEILLKPVRWVGGLLRRRRPAPAASAPNVRLTRWAQFVESHARRLQHPTASELTIDEPAPQRSEAA